MELVFQMALVEGEGLQVQNDEALMAMEVVLVLPEHHKSHHLPRYYYCIVMPFPLLVPFDDTFVVVVVVVVVMVAVVEIELVEEGEVVVVVELIDYH